MNCVRQIERIAARKRRRKKRYADARVAISLRDATRKVLREWHLRDTERQISDALKAINEPTLTVDDKLFTDYLTQERFFGGARGGGMTNGNLREFFE